MNHILSLKNIVCLIGLSTAFLLVGCGSLQTKVRNEEALTQVKKVAVISFKAELPASREIGLNLGSGKAEGSAGGSMITQNSAPTDQMLTEFNKSLGQEMKWSVIDTQKMKASPVYQKLYKQTMEGWQNKMPPGAGLNVFLVEGVMDTDSPRIMGPEGRDELIAGLGVDAIAVLSVRGHLKGTTVMGIGSRLPQANVHLQMYKKGVEGPIWFETFEGAESTESVGKTGFIDEKKLAELSLKSAQSAYSKMGVTAK